MLMPFSAVVMIDPLVLSSISTAVEFDGLACESAGKLDRKIFNRLRHDGRATAERWLTLHFNQTSHELNSNSSNEQTTCAVAKKNDYKLIRLYSCLICKQ
jgi:hypothetical protein